MAASDIHIGSTHFFYGTKEFYKIIIKKYVTYSRFSRKKLQTHLIGINQNNLQGQSEFP